VPRGLAGEVHGIPLDLLNDGWPLVSQAGKLILGELRDARVVAAPAQDDVGQLVDLRSPNLIVRVDRGRSNDQQVDIAGDVSVAASRAAEERGVCRRDPEAPNPLLQAADQLDACVRHLLDGGCEQVLAVQRVKRRVAHIEAVDEAMVNEAFEHVLYAGLGAPRSYTQMLWMGVRKKAAYSPGF